MADGSLEMALFKDRPLGDNSVLTYHGGCTRPTCLGWIRILQNVYEVYDVMIMIMIIRYPLTTD